MKREMNMDVLVLAAELGEAIVVRRYRAERYMALQDAIGTASALRVYSALTGGSRTEAEILALRNGEPDPGRAIKRVWENEFAGIY